MEMLKKCNLDAEYLDDILENFTSDEEQNWLDEHSENYTFLPNVQRVKEILGDAAEKIIAEGKNWFIISTDDYSCEIYEQLDNEGLFPYFCYDEHIDRFR